MNSFKPENEGQSGKTKMEVKSFQPRALQGDVVHSYDQVKEKYGNLTSSENTGAKTASGFSLDPAARRSLGIEKEELRHIEGRIQEEVEKRIAQLKQSAYQDGFNQGRSEGETQAKAEFTALVQPEFDRFTKIVSEFEESKQDIYQANEQLLIQLVFQVSRQIILKELKTDSEYVKRLCSQLVEKIGAKDHVKIKVSREDHAQIESIREFLKQQFVDLKNIQIDVSDDIVLGGCKVETDLARIDATVQTQLEKINESLSGGL